MSRTVILNDGHKMPMLGLGVMQIPDDKVPQAMREAAELGYRLFDTAPVYRNEPGTGRGVKECGLPREEVYVTTKLWNGRQGYDEALRAFDESMEALGLEYLDLYLIHWPCPAKNLYVDSWKALIRLREEGRVRSIGVSNFLPPHMERRRNRRRPGGQPDRIPSGLATARRGGGRQQVQGGIGSLEPAGPWRHP
jgi:2,5-diketo-D-gluconate reductase A